MRSRLWTSKLELPPLQLLAELPQHMAAGSSKPASERRPGMAADFAASWIQRNTLGRLRLRDADSFLEFMHMCALLPFRVACMSTLERSHHVM